MNILAKSQRKDKLAEHALADQITPAAVASHPGLCYSGGSNASSPFAMYFRQYNLVRRIFDDSIQVFAMSTLWKRSVENKL